jgi:hypothetical protein
MRGTRALFASIGVSVALVAAAALSLFTVSIVIAFGGWSAGMGESELPPALVFAGTAATQPTDGKARTATAPVVLRAPARARPRRAASAPARTASRTVRRVDAVARGPVARRAPAVTTPSVDSPVATATPAAEPEPAPAPAPKPKTGDGVRGIGDHLSSTTQGVGKALSDVTEPLAPPLASGVQRVVGLVADLLKRTTDGLGATLDKTLK